MLEGTLIVPVIRTVADGVIATVPDGLSVHVADAPKLLASHAVAIVGTAEALTIRRKSTTAKGSVISWFLPDTASVALIITCPFPGWAPEVLMLMVAVDGNVMTLRGETVQLEDATAVLPVIAQPRLTVPRYPAIWSTDTVPVSDSPALTVANVSAPVR